MTLGQELRRRRIERKLSLAALADRTNISKGHLSRIENGRSVANETIVRVCDEALGAGGALITAFAAVPQQRRRGLRTATPFELPRETVFFVGRKREAGQAVAALGGKPSAGRICLLHGMAGSGKTALAIRVAHELAHDFADGVIFIDLHGYTPGASAVPAHEALGRLLPRLGVASDQVPEHVEDRAGLWRSRLRGRSALLLFDNASSVGQVAALLPSEPGCAVIITSRDRLNAFDDVHRVEVAPLSDEDAMLLFRGIARLTTDLGPDVDAKMLRVTKIFAGLPLAVRITAARRWHDVSAELEALWQRMSHEDDVIEEIEDGTRDVYAAFATSVESLAEPDQRMFTMLALHPGADFDTHATAALAGVGLREAEKAVGRLFDAHLLMQYVAGRFRFHDLVRSFAGRLAHGRLSSFERAQATGRLVDYYLAAADAADRLITPHRYRPFEVATVPAVRALHNGAEALSWLTVEQANLARACQLASVSRLHEQCWRLAFALRGYYFVSKQYDDCVSTHRLALSSAIAIGDVRAQVYAHNNIGLACIERSDVDTAAEHYQVALDLAESVGDRLGAATARANRGWAQLWRGDYRAALGEFDVALPYYQRSGMRRNNAITRRGIALAQGRLGQTAEACRHLRTALRTFVDLDLGVDAAMALNCLGEILHASGYITEAIQSHERALDLAAAASSEFEVARARVGIGDALASRGEVEVAQTHWQEALDYAASLRLVTIEEFRSRVFGPLNGAGPARDAGDQAAPPVATRPASRQRTRTGRREPG